MLKAAATEGDWEKVREIVKGFEKMLSEKEAPNPGPDDDEEESEDEGEGEPKAEESRRAKEAAERKKLQESFNLRIKARDLAADRGLVLSAGRRRVLDACTTEKEITEALDDFAAEAVPLRGQKPKSGPAGGQQHSHSVREQAVPDTVKDGKTLAEWMRS
jgi:hypothetical protein